MNNIIKDSKKISYYITFLNLLIRIFLFSHKYEFKEDFSHHHKDDDIKIFIIALINFGSLFCIIYTFFNKIILEFENKIDFSLLYFTVIRFFIFILVSIMFLKFIEIDIYFSFIEFLLEFFVQYLKIYIK